MIRQHECVLNNSPCPLRLTYYCYLSGALSLAWGVKGGSFFAQWSLFCHLSRCGVHLLCGTCTLDCTDMNRADLHPTPSEDGQPRGVAKIKKWRPRLPIALRETLPRLGEAGSRSALLHEQPSQGTGLPSDSDARLDSVPAQSVKMLMPHHVLRLRVATWLGCFGTVMVALGGLGAGAFPVVGNPYWDFPLASFLSRLLHTSTVTVFLGIGMLVAAWLLLTSFTLPPAPTSRRRHIYLVPERTLWRIFACWVAPILFTAPMFTQDIYSYLAQGSIAAQGLDPYSAGPVDLLGIQDPLARSVPLLWAHSPAPYSRLRWVIRHW